MLCCVFASRDFVTIFSCQYQLCRLSAKTYLLTICSTYCHRTTRHLHAKTRPYQTSVTSVSCTGFKFDVASSSRSSYGKTPDHLTASSCIARLWDRLTCSAVSKRHHISRVAYSAAQCRHTTATATRVLPPPACVCGTLSEMPHHCEWSQLQTVQTTAEDIFIWRLSARKSVTQTIWYTAP